MFNVRVCAWFILKSPTNMSFLEMSFIYFESVNQYIIQHLIFELWNYAERET